MKALLIVLKFELFNFLKNKTFKIATIIISLILIIGLSVPTIMDAFGKPLFGEDKQKPSESLDDKIKYGFIIENNTVDIEEIKIQLPKNDLILAKDKEELTNLVILDNISAGFVINSPTKYEYLVKNTSMNDGNRYKIENALLHIYRNKSLVEKGIDSNKVSEIYSVPIEYELSVLGKDSTKNFMYTYFLVIGMYFFIMFYGQITATSIASEKSNRTMEILVTSTSTKSLIFGKVFAGAMAGIIQFGTMIIVAILAYKANVNAWDNNLDFVFNIPGNVMLAFIVFGVLGYLFYLFIYGVVGALVSRTEDVGTSSTPLTIVFIGAFFIAILGLTNPDMLVLKIASFIPLTSFMAMFVRVSMGSVSTIQVIISLVLLSVSTLITGIFAAKIYRLGTLMYGNPVKITQAFKLLKDK